MGRAPVTIPTRPTPRTQTPVERAEYKRRFMPVAVASFGFIFLTTLGLCGLAAGLIGSSISGALGSRGFSHWPTWCWWAVGGGATLLLTGLGGLRLCTARLRRIRREFLDTRGAPTQNR